MNCWCDTLMHHLPIFIIPDIYLMKYDLCLNYLNFINDDCCCCCCCYLEWILTRCDLWCTTRQSQHSLKNTCIINTSNNTTTKNIQSDVNDEKKTHFFLHNSRQIRASGCLYRYLARKEQCLTFDPIYYPSFIRT